MLILPHPFLRAREREREKERDVNRCALRVHSLVSPEGSFPRGEARDRIFAAVFITPLSLKHWTMGLIIFLPVLFKIFFFSLGAPLLIFSVHTYTFLLSIFELFLVEGARHG